MLNPTTGAVLAMVSNPTFDPNLLANPDSRSSRRRDYARFGHVTTRASFPLEPIATQERLRTGSTFKVVTSTAVYNLEPSLDNFNFPSCRCRSSSATRNPTLTTTAASRAAAP